ncbi:MAG TPA: YceI family protein [Ohtaekwangia sp.]
MPIRLLLFLLLPQFALAQVSFHTLVVQPASTLTISGKTNVSKYECTTARYSGSDTLVLRAEIGKGVTFSKGIVRLAATEFDCGMQAITKDFRQTLEAEKFPNILIDFISFEREPRYATTEEKFKGKLKLTVAGKDMSVEIRCSIVKDEKGFIHLKGSRNFLFSDFGLKARSKMMGMVKVHEKIMVQFHLVLLKR